MQVTSSDDDAIKAIPSKHFSTSARQPASCATRNLTFSETVRIRVGTLVGSQWLRSNSSRNGINKSPAVFYQS